MFVHVKLRTGNFAKNYTKEDFLLQQQSMLFQIGLCSGHVAIKLAALLSLMAQWDMLLQVRLAIDHDAAVSALSFLVSSIISTNASAVFATSSRISLTV